MKIIRIFLTMTIMFAVVFTSCKQKDGEKKSADSEAIGSEEISETLLSINPALRDPSIMMVALDMAGAEYIEGLVNPWKMSNTMLRMRLVQHLHWAFIPLTLPTLYPMVKSRKLIPNMKEHGNFPR